MKKRICISLLFPCLVAIMISGCGQGNQDAAAEKIKNKEKAVAGNAEGKISQAEFDGMVKDWLKKNKDKLGDVSLKDFGLMMKDWSKKNGAQINRGNFTQKDLDSMLANWIRRSSEGHGHEH
ncbi:MAG: hypothetical protein QF437_10600 [Planctomycetota bacterium]|nr:hypothetical protein [Planctomycetota bacterium]